MREDRGIESRHLNQTVQLTIKLVSFYIEDSSLSCEPEEHLLECFVVIIS
jgi:hypothetical protein